MKNSTTKAALRQQARKRRASLDPREEDPQSAYDLFFETFQPAQTQIIAAYWPVKSEFDPIPVLRRAMGERIQCALPVIQKGNLILNFHEWDDNTEMQKNALGIPESILGEVCFPDIIICPLLAFDLSGTRLGQGGGYYDATLEHLRKRKKLTAIGLAFDAQEAQDPLPCEGHDQKLDAVLTPTRFIAF